MQGMSRSAYTHRCTDTRVIDPDTPRRVGGRRPSLTPEQVAEIKRRTVLRRQNSRKQIAADFRISLSTLDAYLSGGTRKHWEEQ